MKDLVFTAPLYVAWETTHRCNAKCLHCYSDSSPTAATSRDLTTAEALRVIDELAEAGVLVLAFSGGEPMLRPDWETLAAHAIARGLAVNIATNGSMVTEARADTLACVGVHSVTISIDSHRAEVHDHFRQTPGLFPRALRAVERLVDRNVRVVVGYTPTRLNWHDGPNVVDLALGLGASAVNLSEYVPAGRGPISLALEPNELRTMLETWIRLRARLKDQIELMWHDCRVGMLAPPEEQRAYVGCGAGRLVARICPDGAITPCVFLPTIVGSLRDAPFKTIWATSQLMASFRERQGHLTGNCGTCEYIEACGGCRTVAFAYSGGDPLAGDPHCWINEVPVAIAAHLCDGEALPI
ncbi:MAG: radical SAM protein [Acidimicrobiia bacterium]